MQACFTLLLVGPYRSFSLAAGFLAESLRARFPDGDRFRLLIRSYSRCLTEVDASFVRDVLAFKPQVVGFSCFFWTLHRNLVLAQVVKSLRPDTLTVFGGPQVGDRRQAADLLKAKPCIDAILCGEADLSFPELVCRVFIGNNPSGIDGLVRKKTTGEIYVDPNDAWVRDLDALPLIYDEASPYAAQHLNPNDVVPFQTLRGCRKQCAYCLYPTHRLRFFSLDRVARELAFLCRRKVRHIRVCDSHFGGSKTRAMEIFDLIRQLNADSVFYLYPDPGHVDADYVRAARSANCRIISLGIETMDPQVSMQVWRKNDIRQVRQALSILHAHGEPPQVDMMVGLPKQTPQSFCRDLVQLRIDEADPVLFSPLMLFPGTRLAAASKEQGVSVIETPQRFGYDATLGSSEYGALLLMAERYRLLNRLHRTDWYVRITYNDDSLYAAWLQRWFSAEGDPVRRGLLEICEALEFSSEYIRAHIDALTGRMRALLVRCLHHDPRAFEFLPAVLQMDLMETAMQRRKEELSLDIRLQPANFGVLFADEILQQPWMLVEDAWLKSYDAPRALLSKNKAALSGEPHQAAFCLYVCSSGDILLLDQDEFQFLARFKAPNPIFDQEHPYSSAAFNMARKLLAQGVLRPPKIPAPTEVWL